MDAVFRIADRITVMVKRRGHRQRRWSDADMDANRDRSWHIWMVNHA